MEGLSLTNFKSYRKLSMFGLNPNINVIMGGNGQGKSNIFKALSFVLSDRLLINRTEFHNCVHRGLDVSEDRQIEVDLVLRDQFGAEELLKISKVWKPALTEECYVNNKVMGKKEYENYIDGLSLSYTNPYNIVQQGKITQITLMDQFELYKLLEQITGVRKFNKRKEEALNTLKKVDQEKQQAKVILTELDEKLKSLENRKEEFQFFAIEQKTKKYRSKKHLSELLEGTKHNIDKIKNQYDELMENLSKIVAKRKDIEQAIEDNRILIKTEKQKLVVFDRVNMENQSQVMETQQLKQLEKRQKQLHKELKQNAKILREKDKTIEAFKKGFSEVEQTYQTMKMSKQLSKPKEQREKLIEAFQQELSSQSQKLSELQTQKNKLNQSIQQGQKMLKAKANQQTEQEYSRLQLQLSNIASNLEDKRKLVAQLAWQKNIVGIECQASRDAVQQLHAKIRKVGVGLDFQLIETVRKEGIRGIYGYFLEFVQIDPSLSFAYEIAGLSKLCSLLVENEEACMAVIEANRKLKGRQINIIQLDYLRSKPAESVTLPKSSPAKKLSSPKWIKLNNNLLAKHPESLGEDLEKLIKNTFERYALVKDYETGLRVSKEFHINCVSGDRETIYAHGYHCKLGQGNIYSESVLELATKYLEKREAYVEKVSEKKELDEQAIQYQNEEIQLMNHQNKLQFQLNKLSSAANQLKSQKKIQESYTRNLQQVEKTYSELQASLDKKQETLNNLVSSKASQAPKFSQQQFQKQESAYTSKRKQFNHMLLQIYQIQQHLSTLNREKEALDQHILKIRNNKTTGILNPEAYLHQISNNLQTKQKDTEQMEQEMEHLLKMEREVEANKDHVEVKLITYRAEEEDLESRIADIGEIAEDVEELEELSNSMSVSHMMGRRKNQHYSAKDKLLFTKFSNILESFSAHKKNFKELEESQDKIRSLISKYERESEEYMSQIGEKFEKEFIDIFKSIVNQGHAEVRLKKISQKVKDVIKYKNCMTIKVSFSQASDAMKKFSDFSGGQKTLIAISMILALQRCEPAPFYILDEVDSALDSIYVYKIMQLLTRQSQRNKCQYLISSFKEEMTNFPQEICNYYLVHNQNRESTIEKIRQSKAQETIKSISMRK